MITRTLIGGIYPLYGIGFRREMDLGPFRTVWGDARACSRGGEEKPGGERIDKWRTFGIEQRVYEKGLLRDVYPWNFLTNLQLSRQIEGILSGSGLNKTGHAGLFRLLRVTRGYGRIREADAACPIGIGERWDGVRCKRSCRSIEARNRRRTKRDNSDIGKLPVLLDLMLTVADKWRRLVVHCGGRSDDACTVSLGGLVVPKKPTIDEDPLDAVVRYRCGSTVFDLLYPGETDYC